MSVQVILMRQFISVFYGNELSIGILLTIWLFWVGAGSLTGNSLWKATALRIEHFPQLLIIPFIFGLGAFVAIKSVRVLLSVPFGEFIPFWHLTIFAAVVLFLPCFAFGSLFSYLAMQKSRQLTLGEPAAHIYIYESVGSVAAGLFASFALFLTNLQILFSVALFASFVFIFYQKQKILPVIFFVIFATILPQSYEIGTALQNIYWQSAQGSTVKDWRQTKYGQASIVEWGGETFFYRDGVKQSALPDNISAQKLSALIMTQHPNPKRILIIGGSLGGLAPACARFSDATVHVLEHDEEAFYLASAYLDSTARKLWENPRIKIFFKDARHFFIKNDIHYDIIALNIGHPTTALTNRFYTVEFFQQITQHIAPKGVFAVCNFLAGENVMGSELAQLNSSLYETLKMVFNDIVIVPGEAAVYFASKSRNQLLTDPEELAQRFRQKNVSFDHFYPSMFKHLYQPERRRFFNERVTSVSHPRINYDFKPIAYFYDFLIWHKITHGEQGRFAQLAKLKSAHLFYIIFVFIGLWLLFNFLLKQKLRVANIALVTLLVGFTGLVFNVILILAFQTIFGYIYTWIGLAIAAYMLGMASAGFVFNRYIDIIKTKPVLMVLLALIVITALLLMPFFRLSTFLLLPVLFFLVILWSGALTGAAFPLFCRAYSKEGQSGHGTIYACDLLGGAAGAFLLCGVMIPLFGFQQILWLIALLNFGGLVIMSFFKK